MIPIKNDKKLFDNINYIFLDNISKNNMFSDNNNITKNYVNFIDVPKRFQNIETTQNNDEH